MRGWILIAAMGLAGCGGAADEPKAPPKPQAPSEIQQRVAALSPAERNAVLIRAIRDANLDCQGVTQSERRGQGSNGDPLYVAKCLGGASFGVVIGRDGTAQVIAAPSG